MAKIDSKLTLALGILFAFVGASHGEVSQIEAPLYLTRVLLRSSSNVLLNDFIDKNIEVIRKSVARLEPMPMRNMSLDVVSCIYVELHSGWLQNLSQLKRTGDCRLKYANKLLSADLRFGWNDLTFQYQYGFKFLLSWMEGRLVGELSRLKIHIRLDIDLRNYLVILQELKFLDASNIEIRMEGSFLDFITNLIIKAATTFFQSFVLDLINEQTVSMIKLDIKNINDYLAAIVHKHHSFTFVDLVNVNDTKVIYR